MYIGVDLGGTNVRAALVDESGTIHHVVIRDSLAHASASVIMDNLVDCICALPNYQTAKGIGLGVPGPVDVKAGWMTMATNIPALTCYPLRAELESRLHLPVFVDNDANVAGLAEALIGAGKGNDVVYYITHSTGIGGALVVHGKIVSGRVGYAGEIGNLIVDLNREHLNHLNVGAIENEASGTALVRKSQMMIDPTITSAAQLFALKATHPQAKWIIETMAADMGTMLSHIAHIVDPDVFVLGGGVTKSSDHYFAEMIASFKAKVHEPLADVPFLKAQLAEPGLIGAAMLPKSQGV